MNMRIFHERHGKVAKTTKIAGGYIKITFIVFSRTTVLVWRL
jgi:hypothetical protein